MAKVIIDKDKCKGCGLCIKWCSKKVLELSIDLNKKGVKYAKVKNDSQCNGCGFCYISCPDFCIEIYEEDPVQKKNIKAYK